MNSQGNAFTDIFSLFEGQTQFRGIFVEHNDLRGMLPEDLFNNLMPRLEQIYLQHNRLSGPLPEMSV